MATQRLELLLVAVDRLTAPLRAVGAAMDGVRRAAERVNAAGGAQRLVSSLGMVTRGAMEATRAVAGLAARVGGVGAVAGVGAGFAFNRQFIRPAADEENALIALRNIHNGDDARARADMAANREFALRTPFAEMELLRGTIGLRNMGLDPFRSGSLRAIGDAAAGTRAIGGTFDQAQTAFAAAMRGEMDPMEFFGVFGRSEKGVRTLDWRDREGRGQRAIVRDDDRAGMAVALTRALRERYAGATEAMAQSWDGRVSNLADAWDDFARRVMGSGVFTWLNEKLQGVLDKLGTLAEDGTLQRWAEDTAGAMMRVFTAVERFFSRAEGQDQSPFEQMLTRLRELVQPLTAITDRFGVMETAIGAVAIIAGGQILGSLAMLVTGVFSLTAALAPFAVAFALSPLGLFLIALAAAIALVATNWDKMTAAFERGRAAGAFAQLDQTPAAGNVQARQGAARATMGDRFYGGPAVDPDAPLPAFTPPGPAAAPAVRLDAGGELRIRIEDNRLPTVTARPNDDRFRWRLDQGLSMVTP